MIDLYGSLDFVPTQPSFPPALTPSNEDYSYHVSFPTFSVVSNISSNWVNFLFKVQDKEDKITRYYWQVYIPILLLYL